MFASLLAASLASRRGLDGWTLTDWLMNAGFAMPSGSMSSDRAWPFAAGADECSGDSSDADEVDCERGCGELVRAECSGDCARKDGERADGPASASGPSGDGDGLTNMDFVPSTRRPPRGGASLGGGAKDDVFAGGATGDDGPAPGDCRGLLTATEGSVGVYLCAGEAGRAERGPDTEGATEDERLPLVAGAVLKGGGTGFEKSSKGGM